MTGADARHSAPAFSPVDGEPPLRWWRRLRLVPSGEIAPGRRAIVLALVAWLPIAIWALLNDRMVHAAAGEPLLQHYGVHVRCLLAIPLLVFAEAALHKAGKALAERFVDSGVIAPETQPRFDQAIRDVVRVRNATLPWVLAIGVAIALSVVDAPAARDDAVRWAAGADGGVGFGGAWHAYVARPIFLALLIGWIWRVGLVAYWMWRVARLPLALVPTHPDRMGGLEFVERLPAAFALVSLAVSATVASRWAHEILHHGVTVKSLQQPALAFVVIWSALMLLPLLPFVPALKSARKRALASYSALVTRHGQLVHRKWILGERVDDRGLLESPEIGPVADAGAMYIAVNRMRSAPISRRVLLTVLVPIAIPLLAVAALQIPLPDLLRKVLAAFV